MKLNWNSIQYYLSIVLMIIILLVISYNILHIMGSNCTEPFVDNRLLNLFNIYNTSFQFVPKITNEEEIFIKKASNLIKKDNLENTDILPYNFGVRINRNTKVINHSRFNMATLNENEKFEKYVKELLNDLDIKINQNRNYKYYGVGWDLEEKKIKISMIHERKRRMVCYTYKVEREGKQVKKVEFINMKYYIMTKGSFLMFKQGKTISYDNNVKIKNSIYLDYPDCKDAIKEMEDKGFKLRSYSNYDNTLNLYFD